MNTTISDPALEHTVMLYNQLIKRWTGTQAGSVTDSDRTDLRLMCDALVAHMLEHFADCACTAEDVRAVWGFAKAHNPLTVADLQHIPRGAIPVVVMRSILGFHRVPVQWGKMQHSAQFSQQYKPVLT